MTKPKKYKIKKLWSIGGYDFYGVRMKNPETKILNAIGIHTKEGRKLTDEQMKNVEKDIDQALRDKFKITYEKR